VFTATPTLNGPAMSAGARRRLLKRAVQDTLQPVVERVQWLLLGPSLQVAFGVQASSSSPFRDKRRPRRVAAAPTAGWYRIDCGSRHQIFPGQVRRTHSILPGSSPSGYFRNPTVINQMAAPRSKGLWPAVKILLLRVATPGFAPGRHLIALPLPSRRTSASADISSASYPRRNRDRARALALHVAVCEKRIPSYSRAVGL